MVLHQITECFKHPKVLTETRRLLGMSQVDLAHRSGVSASLLSQIERGKKPVTDNTRDRFLAAFVERDSEILSYKRPPIISDFVSAVFAALKVRP